MDNSTHISQPTRLRSPWRIALTLCALLFLAASACSPQRGSDTTKEQDTLLKFLGYIADTPENRIWVSYGDVAAWHASWNVPRFFSMDDVNQLDVATRTYWSEMMPSQTDLPYYLNPHSQPASAFREEYGFDVFGVERFIQAGNSAGFPPAPVMELSADPAGIANTLAANSYTVEDYGGGWVLYYRNINNNARTEIQRIFPLDSILLSGHWMITHDARDGVEPLKLAIDAYNGQTPSLADDKYYLASVEALYDPSLKKTGDLVGVTWLDGWIFSHAAEMPKYWPDMDTSDPIYQDPGFMESLKIYLPEFSLAAFATRHNLKDNATYLILALVHPEGTDGKEASRVLKTRLEKAVSVMKAKRFLEAIGAKDVKTYSVQAEGLPVTLAVLRVDDPKLEVFDEKGYPGASVGSWHLFTGVYDLVFLHTGE